tara:strand:- start:2013 stop:3113 length:1101 start_codon:yes stop_codon:yes gene_type:complete
MNMLKQGYNGLKFSALTLAVGLVIGVSCAYAQTVSDPVAPEDPFAALNQQAQTNQPQAVQPQFAPMGNTLPTANQNTLQGYSLTPEEAAELEARMEEQAAEREAKVRDKSFDAAVDSVLPLRPDEIREMLEYFRKSRQAAETPIVVPEAKVQVETISLDPGSIPSLIKLAPGHVTTLNLLDITGKPWPIRDVSWAGDFDITPPEEGGHVIRITPLSAHGIGNMSIQLVDLATPITFSLQTGLTISHYRFDARIPEMGPLAAAPLIDQGGLTAIAGDRNLISFLEGVPPEASDMLDVQGVDARTKVWTHSGQYFVRTPLVLLSPAWNSSVKSSDGMNVYAMNEASVLLLSDNGRMVQAYVAPAEEEY